jgi:endonuclease/exonuclease/phosphatase (EEP) superfamily protein YafD
MKLRRLHLSGVLLLALAGSATLLALLARQSWLLELFTHYRPYYLLALLLAAGVLLPLHRRLAVLAAVLALLNLLWVAPYLAGFGSAVLRAEASGEPVRIIALNLWYRNDQHQRVLDYLRGRDADVLVLSELTPAWRTALAELEPGYPYRELIPQPGSQGIGVYSRLPLDVRGRSNLGFAGSNNVLADLELPGGTLAVYAVHLAAPMSADKAAGRNAQLDTLASLLAARQAADPQLLGQLVIGDLNITPFSPWFRDFLAAGGLEDVARRRGLLLTWPAAVTPPLIGIDHALVTPGTPVVALRTGPRVGSDHLPLELTLDALPLSRPVARR